MRSRSAPDPGHLSFGPPPVAAALDADGNWHIPGGPEGGRFARRGTPGWSLAKAAALRAARGLIAEALARDKPDGTVLRLAEDAPAHLARRLAAAEGAVQAVWRDAEHALVHDRDGRPVAVPWKYLDAPEAGTANDLPDVFSSDDAVGDCYPTAIHVARSLEAAGKRNVRVVHGTVRYQGSDPRVPDGAHITHAWVEYDEVVNVPDDAPPELRRAWDNRPFPVVVDRSNGNNVETPRQVYYGIGEVENPTRYTVEEAQLNMLRSGHYGPWDTPEAGASNDLVTAPGRDLADYVTPGVLRWTRKLAGGDWRASFADDYEGNPSQRNAEMLWDLLVGVDGSRQWIDEALTSSAPDRDAIETLQQAHLAAVDELGAEGHTFERTNTSESDPFAGGIHINRMGARPASGLTSWYRTDGPYANAYRSSWGQYSHSAEFDSSRVLANIGMLHDNGEYLIAEDPATIDRLMAGDFPAVRSVEAGASNDLPRGVAARMLGRTTIGEEEAIGGELAEMLTVDGLPLGVTTRADLDGQPGPNRADAESPLVHEWIVSGQFLDPDGNEVGAFNRQFHADRAAGTVTVVHDTIHLDEEWRGNGIGPQFIDRSIDAYRDAGFTRMTTHGASTVGGAYTDGAYVWARQGWKWDLSTGGHRRTFLRSAVPVARALDNGDPDDPGSKAAARLRALIAKVERGEQAGADDIQPVDIAVLRRGDLPIGKLALDPAANPFAPPSGRNGEPSIDFAYQRTLDLPEQGAANDLMAGPGRFGWVPQPAFPVENVQRRSGVTDFGTKTDNQWTGRVADPGHPVIGYRGVSSTEEFLSGGPGGWMSMGKAMASGERGTAFSATPESLYIAPAVPSWGGDYRDLFFTTQVAVDLRGLPFETITEPDGDTIAASRNLGLAITGQVPFDRIVAVRELTEEGQARLDEALLPIRALADEAARNAGYRDDADWKARSAIGNRIKDKYGNDVWPSLPDWQARQRPFREAVNALAAELLADPAMTREYIGPDEVAEWLDHVRTRPPKILPPPPDPNVAAVAKTRSSRQWVIASGGRIIGYSDDKSAALRRADKIKARVYENPTLPAYQYRRRIREQGGQAEFTLANNVFEQLGLPEGVTVTVTEHDLDRDKGMILRTVESPDGGTKERHGPAVRWDWLRVPDAEPGVANDMPDQPGFRVRDVPRTMRGSGPAHHKWLKGLKVGDAVIHVHGDHAATGTVATIDEATPRYVKIGGARFDRTDGDQHGSFGFIVEPTPDVIAKLGELGAEQGVGNDLPADAPEGERKLVSALLHYQQGVSWSRPVYGELGAAVQAVAEGRPVPPTNPDPAMGYIGGQEKLEADARAIVEGLARYSTPVDGTIWRGASVALVDSWTPEQRAVPSQDITFSDGAWRFPDGTPTPTTSWVPGDPPKVGDTIDAGMLSFTKSEEKAKGIAASGVALPDENAVVPRPPDEQVVYRLDNAVGYPLPNYVGEQEVVAAGRFEVTAVDRDPEGRWIVTLTQTPPSLPADVALQALADEPVVARIVDRYEAAGHPVYVVGGAVRDALAGKAPNDIDLTSPATPEQTSELLDPIGAVYPLGIEHGTVVVNTDGQDYEVTTHRTERYDPGSRSPITEFTDDLTADLSRRDFTVNAMAYNPATRELIDPFGGRADLEAGIIRAVGDPDQRFGEDPLRIIRAVRFAAVNGWAIDPATEAAAKRQADRLSIVSVERVSTELDKVLKSPRPGALRDAHTIADRFGVTDRMFGPLAPAFTRPTEDGWVPIDDVPAPYRLPALVAAAGADPGVLVSQMKRGRDEARDVANVLNAARMIRGGQVAGALRRYPDDVIVAVEALTTYATPMLAGHWVNRQRLRGPLPVNGDDMLALGLTGREVGAALARIEAAFLANGGFLTREQALDLARP